mmetsp:Transcript_43714/g.125068  ORF Transcript_43714/g.125068 Transcript_43714/m.125068 type:complete len:102 (+) Transcript_43714:348-653(+)
MVVTFHRLSDLGQIFATLLVDLLWRAAPRIRGECSGERLCMQSGSVLMAQSVVLHVFIQAPALWMHTLLGGLGKACIVPPCDSSWQAFARAAWLIQAVCKS